MRCFFISLPSLDGRTVCPLWRLLQPASCSEQGCRQSWGEHVLWMRNKPLLFNILGSLCYCSTAQSRLIQYHYHSHRTKPYCCLYCRIKCVHFRGWYRTQNNLVELITQRWIFQTGMWEVSPKSHRTFRSAMRNSETPLSEVACPVLTGLRRAVGNLHSRPPLAGIVVMNVAIYGTAESFLAGSSVPYYFKYHQFIIHGGWPGQRPPWLVGRHTSVNIFHLDSSEHLQGGSFDILSELQSPWKQWTLLWGPVFPSSSLQALLLILFHPCGLWEGTNLPLWESVPRKVTGVGSSITIPILELKKLRQASEWCNCGLKLKRTQMSRSMAEGILFLRKKLAG